MLRAAHRHDVIREQTQSLAGSLVLVQTPDGGVESRSFSAETVVSAFPSERSKDSTTSPLGRFSDAASSPGPFQSAIPSRGLRVMGADDFLSRSGFLERPAALHSASKAACAVSARSSHPTGLQARADASGVASRAGLGTRPATPATPRLISPGPASKPMRPVPPTVAP